MTYYKDFLSDSQELPLIVAEIDGRTKYFTMKERIFSQETYEMNPKVVGVYYSRYLNDPMMYREFDMGTYIKNQLCLGSIQTKILFI